MNNLEKEANSSKNVISKDIEDDLLRDILLSHPSTSTKPSRPSTAPSKSYIAPSIFKDRRRMSSVEFDRINPINLKYLNRHSKLRANKVTPRKVIDLRNLTVESEYLPKLFHDPMKERLPGPGYYNLDHDPRLVTRSVSILEKLPIEHVGKLSCYFL